MALELQVLLHDCPRGRSRNTRLRGQLLGRCGGVAGNDASQLLNVLVGAMMLLNLLDVPNILTPQFLNLAVNDVGRLRADPDSRETSSLPDLRRRRSTIFTPSKVRPASLLFSTIVFGP